MPNILDTDVIRKKLIACLTGEMSIKAFNDWFIPATWDVTPTALGGTRKLVNEILLTLAEYTGGYLTDADLQRNLGRLVETVPSLT